MAQFNISVGGTVIGVIDTLGQNQPSSAAHRPQPDATSVPPMGNGSGASAGLPGAGSDFTNTNATTQSVSSDRA